MYMGAVSVKQSPNLPSLPGMGKSVNIFLPCSQPQSGALHLLHQYNGFFKKDGTVILSATDEDFCHWHSWSQPRQADPAASIQIRFQKALQLLWPAAQQKYCTAGSWWTVWHGIELQTGSRKKKKRLFIFSFEGANLPGFGAQVSLQVFCAKVGCELVTFSGGKGNVKEKKPGNAHVKWTSQVQTMEKLKNWYGGKHFVVVAISHCSSL